MGEGSYEPMNVYMSKDGQIVLLGKANSIEVTKESVYPVHGMIEGSEAEPMNLTYLGTTSSLDTIIKLDEFNIDFLLEIGTPLVHKTDCRFILGTLFEDGFSYDYGDADDLIEFLSILLRGCARGHRDIFLFYWVLGNYYELKVELLDGSDYHTHDGLKSITLDGHAVTPTALMLFKVVNFLSVYKGDTELILDGARVRLKVCKIESKEEEEDN